MTPAVKLVFGVDYDKTRVTEFAAVLSYARRNDVPEGGLDAFLDASEGGIKGIVKAERALRRPAKRAGSVARAAAELRKRPVLAHVPMVTEDNDEFVVLLARNDGKGTLDILASMGADKAPVERLMMRAIR